MRDRLKEIKEGAFRIKLQSKTLITWGWTFHVSKSDFHPDGVFHYSQKPADGDEMWVKFVYHEIIAQGKIIYTSYFSDHKGNIVRAPFKGNWPLKTLNTMEFIEEEGKTILKVIITPELATEKETKTFEESRDTVHKGFSGTFNQLENYLSDNQDQVKKITGYLPRK